MTLDNIFRTVKPGVLVRVFKNSSPVIGYTESLPDDLKYLLNSEVLEIEPKGLKLLDVYL